MTRFLAVAATALGHLLGLARSLAVPCLSPSAAPLVAMASPWYLSASLGLPGRYGRPQTGGVP